MSGAFSFYEAASGLFVGVRYAGPLANLAANTPPGCAAIEGTFDHLAQRVDLASGQVVDYQPPAPPDTATETYAWDAPTRRWLASPTLAVCKAERAAAVQALIEAAEAGQDRAQREALLAIAADLGFTFYVGPELEFFYFKASDDPTFLDRGGYFDETPLDAATDHSRIAEAPAVRPTRWRPANQAGCRSCAPSTMCASVPRRSASSRRRLLLELVGLPTTINTSTWGAITLTASWRFWVA